MRATAQECGPGEGKAFVDKRSGTRKGSENGDQIPADDFHTDKSVVYRILEDDGRTDEVLVDDHDTGQFLASPRRQGPCRPKGRQ